MTSRCLSLFGRSRTIHLSFVVICWISLRELTHRDRSPKPPYKLLRSRAEYLLGDCWVLEAIRRGGSEAVNKQAIPLSFQPSGGRRKSPLTFLSSRLPCYNVGIIICDRGFSRWSGGPRKQTARFANLKHPTDVSPAPEARCYF